MFFCKFSSFQPKKLTHLWEKTPILEINYLPFHLPSVLHSLLKGGGGGGEDPADWDPDSFLHLTLKGGGIGMQICFALKIIIFLQCLLFFVRKQFILLPNCFRNLCRTWTTDCAKIVLMTLERKLFLIAWRLNRQTLHWSDCGKMYVWQHPVSTRSTQIYEHPFLDFRDIVLFFRQFLSERFIYINICSYQYSISATCYNKCFWKNPFSLCSWNISICFFKYFLFFVYGWCWEY